MNLGNAAYKTFYWGGGVDQIYLHTLYEILFVPQQFVPVEVLTWQGHEIQVQLTDLVYKNLYFSNKLL
jgi:hypothetical protein